MEHQWLIWAKQIQAISQAGLAYTKDVYDKERFEMLRAISVEILEHYTSVKMEQIRDLFANDVGYPTPKVDVRAVIFRENEILLVQEKLDGKWSLPGGWADIGLTPKEVAVKEVVEETGLQVEAVRLLGVLDKKCHDHPPSSQHVYKLFIMCEVIGGELTGGLETAQAKYFAWDALPPLSMARNTPDQIKQCFELRSDASNVMLD